MSLSNHQIPVEAKVGRNRRIERKVASFIRGNWDPTQPTHKSQSFFNGGLIKEQKM